MDSSSTTPESEAVVILNFRVPMEVRKQFRLVAVQRGVTMTQLFLELVESLSDEGRTPTAVGHPLRTAEAES